MGKTLHSRNKSTPALSSLLKNPVKTSSFGSNNNNFNTNTNNATRQRTAFADVSNTLRTTTVKDDLAILKDGYGAMVKPNSTLQPLMEMPDTNVQQANKQPALLRPAQRPLSALLLKQAPAVQNIVNSTSIQKNVTSEPEYRSSDPEQLLRYLNRKRTTIFREQPAAPEQEVVTLVKEAVKPVVSTAPVHQVLEAPREKKLPAIPEPLLQSIQPVQEANIEPQDEVKDFSQDLIASIEETFAKAEEIVQAKQEERLHDIPVLPSTSSQETLPQVEPVPQPSDQEIYQLALETQLPPLDAAPAGVKLPVSTPVDYPEYFEEEDDEEYYDAEGYTTARSIRSRGDNTTGGLTTFLEPRVTQRVLKELEAARDYVLATRTEDDIDDEAWDTSMVAEYGDDIFEYMRKLEVIHDLPALSDQKLTQH
jgi:G2/mitotic-specific cyclin 3/4